MFNFNFYQIKEIINEEEIQFLKTLSRGRRLFNREADKATDKKISGNIFSLFGPKHSNQLFFCNQHNL